MNKIFIDSNICIYALDKSSPTKSSIAFELLKQMPLISSQVIVETYNACHRKLKLSSKLCDENTLFLLDICTLCQINEDVIRTAIEFKDKYLLSFLDSCIVAAAFCNNCKMLYSEDMQHNLVIEGILKIVNPFVEDK